MQTAAGSGPPAAATTVALQSARWAAGHQRSAIASPELGFRTAGIDAADVVDAGVFVQPDSVSATRASETTTVLPRGNILSPPLRCAAIADNLAERHALLLGEPARSEGA